MKRIQFLLKSLIACSLVLAGFAANLVAAPIQKSAEVRRVEGVAKYSVGQGPWLTLVKGTELPVGAIVQTGPDSIVDLWLSDCSGAVRLSPNTVIRFDKILLIPGGAGDTETQLNVRSGEVTGRIKKLSKASHFDIKTPNGIAGIRGTDFSIRVEKLPDGTFKITFTSVDGQVVIAAIVNGQVETVALNTNESWVPGGNIEQVAADLIAQYKTVIQDVVRQLIAMPFIEGLGNPVIILNDVSPHTP